MNSSEKVIQEDALFMNFLESNPSAMALYNMVLAQQQQENNENGHPMKSPNKSLILRNNISNPKSPSSSSASSIGKSPKKSLSMTNVIGKSPSKQPTQLVGKSPRSLRRSIGRADSAMEVGRRETREEDMYDAPPKIERSASVIVPRTPGGGGGGGGGQSVPTGGNVLGEITNVIGNSEGSSLDDSSKTDLVRGKVKKEKSKQQEKKSKSRKQKKDKEDKKKDKRTSTHQQQQLQRNPSITHQIGHLF
eukprot:TRINITY_DN3565_c0_g1_i2.p1 TRINITY_DN3565_c0_g1~~TRINITY_DN3565_c0_g1_i2.p1  ORF type:complete len:255 (-),score=67.88 TRINITY_DN3565_c0_g1_i2:378-1121(-)